MICGNLTLLDPFLGSAYKNDLSTDRDSACCVCCGIAVVGATNVVRELRCAVGFDTNKLRVGALRKLWRYAEPTVVRIEVKVSAVGLPKITEVIVVFKVLA